MSERFFIEPAITGDRALLTGSEVHHLAGVMRAKVGDQITLFDGSGHEFSGQIESLKKDRCELTILEKRAVEREPAIAIIAGVALPKGERQKWLVEKLTELGATQLVPLLTARGVAQPGEQAAARLRRSVIEASKQCGRNRLLDIAPAKEAEAWFAAIPTNEARLLADPAGEPFPNLQSEICNLKSLHFAIGPEGGFTPAEVAAAEAAGWKLVSLGKRILRIETAAIALAATCISLSNSASVAGND